VNLLESVSEEEFGVNCNIFVIANFAIKTAESEAKKLHEQNSKEDPPAQIQHRPLRIKAHAMIAFVAIKGVLLGQIWGERTRALSTIQARKGPLSRRDSADGIRASGFLLPARLMLGSRSALIEWILEPRPLAQLKHFVSNLQVALASGRESGVQVPSGLRTRAQWVRQYPNLLETALTDHVTAKRRRIAEVYQMIKAAPALLGRD
jgi:hypothetical protein